MGEVVEEVDVCVSVLVGGWVVLVEEDMVVEEVDVCVGVLVGGWVVLVVEEVEEDMVAVTALMGFCISVWILEM
jgi:hypothetical protein